MTLKERLIQEIDTMPEDLLAEILNFADFIKSKREKQQNSQKPKTEISARKLSPILRGSKAEDLLKFAGTWQGDDFKECLQSVYETRSPARF
jgi:hypothetical protein